MGITKPSSEAMREATAGEHPGITPVIRDSMAIPSFLHPSPLVRKLVWRRYEVISHICAFRPGETVLEFGCGPGFFLPELSARGCRIIALDLYPQYAKDLCRILGIDASFPEKLSDLGDGSVDTVVAAQVMEHIDEPEGYYRGFRRVLAPGGRLVMSLPTENLLYRAGKAAAGFGRKGGYHVSNIGPLVELAGKCGFNVIKAVSIPFKLFPLYRVFELR